VNDIEELERRDIMSLRISMNCWVLMNQSQWPADNYRKEMRLRLMKPLIQRDSLLTDLKDRWPEGLSWEVISSESSLRQNIR
jgi:hypothetical protein